ncbi:uncharacterized protein LOC101859211 isoform X5 [Aplysia californica]|nr:uncharacterized protein LOC101859211 isoform X5 [Aplysia californica]
MIQLVTNMLEESSNIAASNFISSLVKSLQILCNGQVDFNESIELIGHINVRVDHKFKFNYIVDEQVSKEGDDASTTFLSNSYHSSPPSRLSTKQVPHDEEIIDSQRAKKNVKKSSDIPHDKPRQSASAMGSLSDSEETESAQQKYSVKYDAPVVSETAGNHMVIKVEGDDPSDDCVVLPGSPGEYNECGESSGSLHSEGQQFPGSSGCYVGSQNEHQSGPGPAKKQRQSREQDGDEFLDDKVLQRSSLQRFVHGRMFIPTLQKTDYDSQEVTSAYSGNSRSAKRFQDTHMSGNIHWTSTESPSGMGMGGETSQLGTVYICQLCSTTFSSQDEHSAHMTQMHQYVPCPHCDTWCPSSSAIKGHIHREHQPKFVCDLCGKRFHCKINYKG